MASLEGGHASSRSAPPQSSQLHVPPTKYYQDEDETHDSKLKALWDSEMADLKSEYTPYKKVSVLLLSWHKDIDDLKTDEEVTALENVFQDRFMYETTRKTLAPDPRTSPQVQVNHFLSQFVFDNDDKNVMLIIYYAGHGRPGEGRGSLKLAASTSLRSDDLHEIVWTSAETNIRETKADVLVIFDCCHAGELERSVRGPHNHRAFEYLAATSANSTTRKPGKTSFTRALIWSLGSLLDKHTCFSTQKLLQTIHNDAPNFPKDQSPRLSEGQHPTQRKIMIAPLTQESKKRADEASQTTDVVEEEEGGGGGEGDFREERRQDLLLRFVFDRDITEPILMDIASHMKRLIQQREIKAKAVSWEGVNIMKYKDAAIAQNAITYFSKRLHLHRIRRRSEMSPAKEAHQLRNGSSEAVLAEEAAQEVQRSSASPSADEAFVATPKSRECAEAEIGEDQGVSRAEKPESPYGGSILPLSSPLDGGNGVPESARLGKSKRRREMDEDGSHGPSASAKRGKAEA